MGARKCARPYTQLGSTNLSRSGAESVSTDSWRDVRADATRLIGRVQEAHLHSSLEQQKVATAVAHRVSTLSTDEATRLLQTEAGCDRVIDQLRTLLVSEAATLS